MSNEFQQLQDRANKTDQAAWLGRLVWYSVSEVNIKYDQLLAMLATAGVAYMPKRPSDVDVFRRVCSAAQQSRVPGPNGGYENYLVRDLPMDKERVHKVLVRETVESTGLKYKTQLCQLDYVKATSQLEVTCDGSIKAAEIASDIERRYDTEKGSINSYGIRELIRRVLTDHGATNVRGGGGGVYFVAEQYAKVVEGLEKFGAAMPGTVLVHSLPLIDDRKQRNMLKAAYESETIEECNRMMTELSKIEGEAKAGNRKISDETLRRYVEALRLQRRKAKQYKSLLETSIGTADAQLDIFNRQVKQLLLMVD
jgi:hypothetical protein